MAILNPHPASNPESRLLKLLGAKPEPGPAERAIFRRAKVWCARAAWIPGIRLMAVCNSATFFAADAESDIDLFVVTAPRRMWLVRFLLTAFFQICGVRRHGNKVAGRFCLSFFCTTDALNFSKIALPNGDPYLEAWVPRIVPVLDIGGTADTFWDASAAWAPTAPERRNANRALGFGKSLPPAKGGAGGLDAAEGGNMRTYIANPLNPPCSPTGSLRYQGEVNTAHSGKLSGLLDAADALLEKILLPRTLRHWEKLGRPWGVVVTASMLKFHDKDRRKEFRDRLGKET